MDALRGRSVGGGRVHRHRARSLPAALPKYAIIGFCWGGGRSFQYATHSSALGASVVFYGSPPTPEQMAAIKAPVLGLYGGNDARINARVAERAECPPRNVHRRPAHHRQSCVSFSCCMSLCGEGWARGARPGADRRSPTARQATGRTDRSDATKDPRRVAGHVRALTRLPLRCGSTRTLHAAETVSSACVRPPNVASPRRCSLMRA